MLLTSSDACWRATCARGGRIAPSRPRLGPRTRGAVAQREDVRVARGDERRVDDELVRAVDLEPVELGEPGGAWIPAAQATRSACSSAPLAMCTPASSIDSDALAGADRDVELREQIGCRGGDRLGERRQDTGRGLDQREMDVALRIEVLETVARVRLRAVADLRGELDAGRAGADDHDVDRRRPSVRGVLVGADARGEQPPMESLGVGGGVERNRALGDARRAVIVADAADAEDRACRRARARCGRISAPSSSSTRSSFSSRRARSRPITAPWRKRK